MNEESFPTCHRVDVALALTAVNMSKPSESCFLTNISPISLPKLPLDFGKDALDVAGYLFKKLTGTSPTWLPLGQVGTITGKQDGSVVILYGLTMPEKAPLFDLSVEWIDFETLSKDPELLNLFAYACNAYRIGVPQ